MYVLRRIRGQQIMLADDRCLTLQTLRGQHVTPGREVPPERTIRRGKCLEKHGAIALDESESDAGT